MNKRRLLIYTLFLASIIIISYSWYERNAHFREPEHTVDGHTLIALGRISALLGAFLILMQLILIGRVGWLEREFGHDKLSRVHHYNAIIAYTLIVSHVTLIISGYALSSGKGFLAQYFDLISSSPFIIGSSVAFSLLTVVIFTSILIGIKKYKYEWWHIIHLLTYLVIILSFGHQIKLGGDLVSNKFLLYFWLSIYAFVIINFVLYRFIKPLYNFNKHRFKVIKVEKENYNVTSIYIKGRDMKSFNLQAGQFMIFRFLDRERFLQAHPFSLSCTPNKEYLRISAKESGDYTNKLGELKVGTPVIIEGPLGIFTKQRMKTNKVLMIVGGIGITPIRSLIGELIEEEKDIVLLNANKTKKDIVFKKELEGFEKKGLKLYNILSDEKDYAGEKGFVDKEKIERLAEDVKKRDIYLCGPPPMMKIIIRTLKEIGVDKKRIYFEKFSLG